MLIPKPTTKKFYNKWSHKVVLENPNTSSFPQALGIFVYDIHKGICSSVVPWYFKELKVSATNYREMHSLFNKYPRSKWWCRRYYSTAAIFTNDQDFVDEICEKLPEWVLELHSPTPETLEFFEVASDPTILVKQFPHNDFEYKVTVNLRSLQRVIDNEPEKIDWVYENKHLFKVPTSAWAKRYNLNRYDLWRSNYMYVKDKNALLMLRLLGSIPIKKVHKFVLV